MDIGRIEYIATAIIAIIILAAGFTAIKESIIKIINKEEANYSIIVLIIIAITVVVKLVFGRYVKKIGHKINSGSLIGSGSDAIFDAVVSFSTIIAAIISMVWHISLEGFLGIIIGIFIIRASVEMLKETLNNVIGTRIDNSITNKIKEVINGFDEVQGTYDLILHNYGPTQMIGSAHIEVDDDMTAKEIHSLTRKIAEKVYNEFGIVLTIGIYATNTNDEKTADIKKRLNEIIKKYESILQIHGFYVDEKNSVIMFDLMIDFNEKNAEEIKENVISEIEKEYPEYEYYAIIDKDFSD